MIQDLTRDDVVDILHGAVFYGAGGGGELAEGLGLLDLAVASGKSFRMMDLDDVPDDAVLCTPYLLGAISDLPQGDDALVGGTKPPILLAFERLTAYLGQPVFGAVPCELGGSNTAVPFYVAAMSGGVVVDADPAGRAVPEITHSTYALEGLPPAPVVAANAYGETMVLENIASDQRAEEVVRALAQTSRNDIAAIDHAMTASALRQALIPGTLSQAHRLGDVWQSGKADPATLPAKIAAASQGLVLFQGRVNASQTRTEDGFTLGHFTIDGTGTYVGQTLHVTLKNENMAAFLNGAPVATIPEIITLLDLDTGDVVTNPNVQKQQNVAVLVLPAPKPFLSQKGLEVFGPRYAGIDAQFQSALRHPD